MKKGIKNEWLSVVSRACTVRLALESLRANDTARALELLESDLDGTILELDLLSNDKDLTNMERRLVPTTLKQIRTYRAAYPRRVPAGMLDRTGKILDELGD